MSSPPAGLDSDLGQTWKHIWAIKKRADFLLPYISLQTRTILGRITQTDIEINETTSGQQKQLFCRRSHMNNLNPKYIEHLLPALIKKSK